MSGFSDVTPHTSWCYLYCQETSILSNEEGSICFPYSDVGPPRDWIKYSYPAWDAVIQIYRRHPSVSN